MIDLDKEKFIDEDGYPTEEALERIRNWDFADRKELLDFICELWHWDDYAERKEWKRGSNECCHFKGPGSFYEREGYVYIFSTGGWSGNESLINALKENKIIWRKVFWSHRTGGHYRLFANVDLDDYNDE